MKTQISRNLMTVMLALSAALPVAAQARSPLPPVTHAELNRFEVDPKLPYAQSVGSGRVTLDLRRREITLRLDQTMPACPAGQMCIQVMPAPIEITLPIVDTRGNECGVRIVTAKEDLRRVDGNLEVLVIQDFSRSTCPYFKYEPDTRVIHEIVTAGMGGPVRKLRSVYEGGRFLP